MKDVCKEGAEDNIRPRSGRNRIRETIRSGKN
jgi:hypothetical protein